MNDEHVAPAHSELAPINDFVPLSDHPLVSIVIPSLNQAKYIEETILSILNQDCDCIEIIVVDGASQDDTLEILRKYETDSPLRWISEPDDVNEARDKGLKMAKGELVAIQNSSDIFYPGVFRNAVKMFLDDPLLALVVGGIQETDEDGNFNGVTWDLPEQEHRYSVDEIILMKPSPTLQATFFRRDIALKIGGYQKGLPGEAHFFLEYMLEASIMGGHSVRVPQVWATFRRHPIQQHHIFRDRDIRLLGIQERHSFSKQVAQKYKDHLSKGQSKTLRRLGYLDELRYRCLDLHQIVPALPALWGYFRFGGKMTRSGLATCRRAVSYLGKSALSKLKLGPERQ